MSAQDTRGTCKFLRIRDILKSVCYDRFNKKILFYAKYMKNERGEKYDYCNNNV